MILRLAISKGYFKGISPSDGGLHVTNLHFADDTLLFCQSSRFQVCLKVLLYNFEISSGLKVNFSKSSLIGLGALSLGKSSQLATLLNCKKEDLPFKNLGLPVNDKKLRNDDWLKLIERVDKRLSGYKGKSLALGGRLTLVN